MKQLMLVINFEKLTFDRISKITMKYAMDHKMTIKMENPEIFSECVCYSVSATKEINTLEDLKAIIKDIKEDMDKDEIGEDICSFMLKKDFESKAYLYAESFASTKGIIKNLDTLYETLSKVYFVKEDENNYLNTLRYLF